MKKRPNYKDQQRKARETRSKIINGMATKKPNDRATELFKVQPYRTCVLGYLSKVKENSIAT